MSAAGRRIRPFHRPPGASNVDPDKHPRPASQLAPEIHMHHAYHMQRTSILLDEAARRAARELAVRYQCSASEAIRRAIVGHRDAVLGVPPAARRERTAALHRLFELFEGHDAEGEIAALKEQDEHF